MLSSNPSASFPPGQKIISVMMLLVPLYAMAFARPAAMANGSPNIKTTLQSRLVQALKEKGGFTAAATFLGAVDLNRVLPESSTILAPMDEDVTESGLQVSTFNTALPILQYHVITKRLAFNDLQQLPEGETLQTLLQNNTVIITSNSSSNFSVDDVPLSHGNLFLASSMAVHGIRGVLNFAIYGKMKSLPINSQPTAPPASSPSDGTAPAKQPIPPSARKGSSSTGNDTESAPSPAATGNQTQSNSPSPVNSTGTESFNSSFSPPITPATRVPANASSSSSVAPVSLPTPSGPPPMLPLNPSPATPQPPASSSQQALPPILLPTNCNANLVCGLSSSSSHHLKPWLVKDIFYAVTLGLLLVARVPSTPRLSVILYVMLLLMVAVPTSGSEMNVDVSEVLRDKGGFGYAATYLRALDMHRVLPNRSTLLVPTDAAIEATGLIYNTLGAALPTLKYHVVMQQLSFKDLQKLPMGTTLATLLPSSLLLITNNAVSNFTINDVLLSHPDIFCSEGTTVHGISGVMNFSRAYSPAADTSLPQLLTPPRPPQLILPLPESAGPFTAPLPVSQAVSVLKAINVSRLNLLVLLACTSCFLLTSSTALYSLKRTRKLLPASQGTLSLQ